MHATWVDALRARLFEKTVTVYDSYGYRDPADPQMWIVPMRVWVHDDNDIPLAEDALEGWAIDFFEQDLSRALAPAEKTLPRERQAQRPLRRPQGRQLDRLLPRVHPGQRHLGPDHPDCRHS